VKYTAVFAVFAAYLFALAFGIGGSAWLLAWPGMSFALLAAAYAGLGPGIFGKQPDGRVIWWTRLPVLPYLLLTGMVWHVQRRLTREPCLHEIVPGLWLGRRAFAHELPPGVDLIVDLTAEFAEPSGVRSGRTYVCLPTLDAHVPEETAFRAVVERVAAWPGSAFVHCAAGHGRSALLVAAVLLRRGLAKDVTEAIRLVRARRPGVRLNPGQRRLLARVLPLAA
jgi:protein-tyrosine phosphatase